MGLYEKITSKSEDTPKLSTHSFCAAMREVIRGNATKSQLISIFTLDTEDQADIDAIQANVTAFPTAVEKNDYSMQIHDAFLLAEAGIYSKAKIVEVLGLG